MGLIDFSAPPPPAAVARGRKSWIPEALIELQANPNQWGLAPCAVVSKKQRLELVAAGVEIRTAKVDGKSRTWLRLPGVTADDLRTGNVPSASSSDAPKAAPVAAPRDEMAAEIYAAAIKRRSTDALGEVASQLGISKEKAGELVRKGRAKRGGA